MDPRLLALPLLLGALPAGCEAPDTAPRSTNREAPVPGDPGATPSVEAQAKEFAVTSRPGSSHEVLDPLVGSWDVSMSAIGADGA